MHLIAPTSAVQGWEYLFHFEKERRRGEEWDNQRYFLRHTGKYHIVKLESRFKVHLILTIMQLMSEQDYQLEKNSVFQLVLLLEHMKEFMELIHMRFG